MEHDGNIIRKKKTQDMTENWWNMMVKKRLVDFYGDFPRCPLRDSSRAIHWVPSSNCSLVPQSADATNTHTHTTDISINEATQPDGVAKSNSFHRHTFASTSGSIATPHTDGIYKMGPRRYGRWFINHYNSQ